MCFLFVGRFPPCGMLIEHRCCCRCRCGWVLVRRVEIARDYTARVCNAFALALGDLALVLSLGVPAGRCRAKLHSTLFRGMGQQT